MMTDPLLFPGGGAQIIRDGRLDAARNLFDQGKHDDAARLLTDMAMAHPAALHPVDALVEPTIAALRRDELPLLIDACLRLTPQDARLLDLKGQILTQLGQMDDAIEALEESLRRRPGNQNTRTNLVMALAEAGRADEAIVMTRALLEDTPENHGAWSNLGSLLTAEGEFDEALMAYQRSIRLKPDDARVRLNHSISLLKAGRYAQGWHEHEWRLNLPNHSQLPRETLLPSITPDLDLHGKHVLVTQEEGLGDTLMYLRYLPCLARSGAIIRVWGTQTLAALCERVEGVATVQVDGETPAFDYHCPFISLPRVFAATQTPFGAPVPYLRADPAKISIWRKRLAPDRALRVGLVWAGAPRPNDTGAHMVDRRRSMPLSMLDPLGGIPGVALYSLQKGEAAAQLQTFTGPIVDLMSDVETMDDTAALIVNLDVVVSVDTSIVHLAGGLGKSVILMDRLNNCWRWLHDRADTPWYPGLCIIRQTKHQDWRDVVRRVVADIQTRGKQHAGAS